jgi:hypothetical protein
VLNRFLGLATLSAALVLSTSAFAAKEPSGDKPLSGPPAGQGSEVLPGGTPTATVPVSISGRTSPGIECTAETVPGFTVALGAGAVVTGLGWDVLLETVGESWASEATLLFGSQSEPNLISLSVGFGVDEPTPEGGTRFNSEGIIDFTDAEIGNITLDADGLFYISLCEDFADNEGAVDANYLAPSNLTVACSNCSAGSPEIVLSPTSLNLGSANVGSTSAAQNFTISNTGSAAGVVSGLNFAGPFSRALGANSGTCSAPPINLAAGASCTVGVVFQPVATGAANGSASLVLTRAGLPFNAVALQGNGTAASVALSASRLDFGTVPVGSSSPQLTVTLTNSGTGPATVSQPAPTAPFSRTGGSCAAAGDISLAAGASCTFGFTFSPMASDDYVQVLSLSTGGSTLNLELAAAAGNPVLPPVPRAAIVPVDANWALLSLMLAMGLGAGVALRRRG